MRILKPVLIEAVIGIVLGIALTSLFLVFLANGFSVDSLIQGPVMFLAAMGLGLVIWVVLMALFRRKPRARGALIALDLAAAVIALVVDVVVASIVLIAMGGWAALMIMFVVGAGLAFLPAALIANLLTNLVIAPAPATVEAQPLDAPPVTAQSAE